MKPLMRLFDLNSPDEALAYIETLHVDGKPLEYVDTDTGRRIWVADMTDSELMHFAAQLWELQQLNECVGPMQ